MSPTKLDALLVSDTPPPTEHKTLVSVCAFLPAEYYSFVNQKAYVEFFVSPAKLDALLAPR
jgi:hypothetical protein